MSEAALVVGPRALVARELAADVERQPPRVLHADPAAHARSAGADRSRRRCRRRRGGRRRRVDDSGRAQHRVDDGHRARRDVKSCSVIATSRCPSPTRPLICNLTTYFLYSQLFICERDPDRSLSGIPLERDFRSRDKDGGLTNRSAVADNLTLHANFIALSSTKPELLPTEILHCGNREFHAFLPLRP